MPQEIHIEMFEGSYGGRYGKEAGHVRIYQWDGDNWTQRGSDIDGEADGDRSGISVSLSEDGETMAIGTYLNDASGVNAGHVRIHDWQ